jgi:TonB family protein
LKFISQPKKTEEIEVSKIIKTQFKTEPLKIKQKPKPFKKKIKPVKKEKIEKKPLEIKKQINDQEFILEKHKEIKEVNEKENLLVGNSKQIKSTPEAFSKREDLSKKNVKTRARIGSNLTQCKPNYPRTSKRRGEQGTVILRFLINENGKAEKAEIKETSGYERLDDAAKAGLFSCRFVPASENGVFIKDWAVIPYVFQLK